MKADSIFILTGKIHSGKTTAVAEWSKTKKAGGILQPVINGERFLVDLSSEEKFKMNAENNEESISIGDYVFSASAFLRARSVLNNSFYSDAEWLIADEFGKLEMNDAGLEPAVSELLLKVKNTGGKKLLIIIRDYLVNDFLKKENLSPADVFIINSPEKLFYI